MLSLRLSVAAGFCVLLALLAIFQQAAMHPAVERARALLGERWYELSLDGERFGYWVTRTERDRQGRWVFYSEQRSALNPQDPVTITNRRVFAAGPPFELLEARYSEHRRHWQETTEIEHTADGYVGRQRQANADQYSEPVTLSWQYSLIDYLDFEVWLSAESPPAGSVRAINALEFSRLDVVPRQLRIAARNDIGYQIENPAPQAATLIQLDADLAPHSVRLAGLFDLTLSSRQQALAAGGSLHNASYYIPINQPLRDHTDIEWLDLIVTSSQPVDSLWRDAQRLDDQWILSLRSGALAPAALTPVSGASLGYPVTDDRIVRLAAEAVVDADSDKAELAALVGFVHQYLSYQPGASRRSVLSLLERPVGDCTEFAELLTTLARARDLPARTVYGLAYSDREAPAFVFHAWNEVQVDGRWQVVDPTWNQLRVDATHIPLPSNERAAMELLTGRVEMSFALRDLGYFSD